MSSPASTAADRLVLAQKGRSLRPVEKTAPSNTTELDPLREVVYGAVAGSVGKLIEFPCDTIKVRLQSSSQFANASTFSVIRYTYAKEGFVNGFYKGIKAPLVGAGLETSVLFFSYKFSTSFFKNHFRLDDIPLWSKCFSGGVAGFMATFVLTPVELVKCKLQVSNISHSAIKHTYASVVKGVLRKDGPAGLYTGFSSTLVREVFGTLIWFGTYETASAYLNRFSPTTENANLLVSGGLSGFMFNLFMFPVDTIKSNIQTFDVLNAGKKRSIVETARHVVASYGVRGLYNGLGITLVRAVPANAIIFYTYEVLKRTF